MNDILFGNNNKAVIKKLAKRALGADKKRNFFIIAAIALTAFMIASVFSIGMSYYESVNMQEKRVQGSVSHMGFAAVSEEQIQKIYSLDYVKTAGIGFAIGESVSIPKLGDVQMAYVDETQWNEMFCPTFTNIVGHYPKQPNEVMLSRYILEAMGIDNPELGTEIPITYIVDGTDEAVTEVFSLSCIYTEYAHSRQDGAVAIYTSLAFADIYNKTDAQNTTVNVIFKDASSVGESIERLKYDLDFSENQPYIQSPAFDDNYGEITTYAALLVIVVFLMFTGYLLIYNTMYISVSRDIRFYGMLKTMGTTPKQIRRIVSGQIMRLCVIALPVGCLAAAAVSMLIVPAVLSSSGIDTGSVVSFSPAIYGGAILFSFLTALLGAFAPAKKAADISPIEALRYTDKVVMKVSVRTSAKGKPYKMAFRNIFRDRKRAFVVVLSLFIGIAIFASVLTSVVSLDVDNAVDAEYAYDYSLSADPSNAYFLPNEVVSEIKALEGVEDIGIITIEPVELMYSDMLGGYADWVTQNDGIAADKVIVDNAFAWVHGLKGIDLLELKELNKTLPTPIDTEAFERGEIALINVGGNSDMADCFRGVSAVDVKGESDETPIQLAVGGVVAMEADASFSYSAMEILVSNTFIQQHFTDPQVLSAHMNVQDSYDEQIYNTLSDTYEHSGIMIASRYAAKKAMQDAKTIMLALGGGIACILGLIGIFNFVNVMSVGIMVRKRELATLESIGMEKKKVRLMLIFEGLWYAAITLLLAMTFGSAICYGIFRLFKLWAGYAVFSYPVVPVMAVLLLVITVCVIVPVIAYRSISKTTIVERLREAE